MKNKELKLFVWSGFCPDYSSGLAFAIAENEEEAKKLVRKEYGGEPYSWGTLEVKSLAKKTSYYVVGGS